MICNRVTNGITEHMLVRIFDAAVLRYVFSQIPHKLVLLVVGHSIENCVRAVIRYVGHQERAFILSDIGKVNQSRRNYKRVLLNHQESIGLVLCCPVAKFQTKAKGKKLHMVALIWIPVIRKAGKQFVNPRTEEEWKHAERRSHNGYSNLPKRLNIS